MTLHKGGRNIYELKGLKVAGYYADCNNKVVKVNYDYKGLRGELNPSKLIKAIRDLKSQGYKVICNDDLTREL